MPEYPEFAWQEAIINAFAHRDYEDQTREIEVWFFDDRMEVRSPGELIPPVTLDRLRSGRPVHASRNPLLVRVLVDVGLMREEGEGIPRMFQEMEAFHLPAPEFSIEAGEFCVVLYNEPVFKRVSRGWRALVEQLPLSIEQKRVLLAYPEGFTAEDFGRLNRMGHDEAQRQIRQMAVQGVVSLAEGPGGGALYRVAPRLLAIRELAERRLPALQKFFSQHPVLRNADYREMFDLTRAKAKRELSLFAKMGILAKEGERRGAKYRPTAAFEVPQQIQDT